ncbi:hypothetical protein RY003_24015, partial [Salmonella enterica subsp. enterica serovar Enteritidis]|nr:hypothetical protein [Salmonella enterica subsp. enterica serovar Enteritidis]
TDYRENPLCPGGGNPPRPPGQSPPGAPDYRWTRLARGGRGASSDNQALPVEIGLVGEEGYPHQGKVDFLDNQL